MRDGQPGVSYVSESAERYAPLTFALSEAWSWLVATGLLAPSPLPDPQYPKDAAYAPTRLGYELSGNDRPLEALAARRRLGMELHRTIAEKVEQLASVGAMDSAAIFALRTVEDRVRSLAGDPKGSKGQRLTGRALMTLAFAAEGPLADPDPEMDESERVGMRELFTGAFAAMRNPLSHTSSVRWADPIAAAEVVLLADLLLRHLDTVEMRLDTR